MYKQLRIAALRGGAHGIRFLDVALGVLVAFGPQAVEAAVRLTHATHEAADDESVPHFIVSRRSADFRPICRFFSA